MIQLRYLEQCFLCNRVKKYQSNGTQKETFPEIKDYLIQIQDFYDDISASIYGADINKMIRICSPHNVLENYLLEKMNFSNDNITNYSIKRGNIIYEIVSVKKHWIDLKILCEISEN